MIRGLRAVIAALALFFAAASTPAQWSQVTQVPSIEVDSIWSDESSIVAAAAQGTYVSVDGGATWKPSVPLAQDVIRVQAALMHQGRVYAGSYGQGVFVSDDLGDSWSPFNEGLVGGIANSQLYIVDLMIHAGTLYAATSGAGPWVRDLGGSGGWSRFGNALEPAQASNMTAIAAGGTRLFAAGGFNGTVFWRDPGDLDWSYSDLNNVGPAPGLAALSALWTGTSWVVGANDGIYHSSEGHEPWAYTPVAYQPPYFGVPLVLIGHSVLANFSQGPQTNLEISHDDGATWNFVESLAGVITTAMTVSGDQLFAARFDGVWRRPLAGLETPAPPTRAQLRFSIGGPQPSGNLVSFHVDLDRAAALSIDVFDVAGRRVAPTLQRSLGSGISEIAWDASKLSSGVYLVRASSGGQQAVARMNLLR